MATILISKCGDYQATIIDKTDIKSKSGKRYKVIETGFTCIWERTAINKARKYLRELDGAKSRPTEPKPEQTKISWHYDCGTKVSIPSNQITSIADEIKKFKEEQNEKQRNKLRSKNKGRSSRRNVSGVRLDPNWREVYRR